MPNVVVSERFLVEHGSAWTVLDRLTKHVEGMIERYQKADVALDLSTLTIVPEPENPHWLSITVDGRGT